MKFDGFSFDGRINRAKYWRIKIGLFFANFFFHIWVAAQFGHSGLHRPPTATGECGFLEGTRGPNRYGADPLGVVKG